jgi:trehalose synthase
VWRCHIDIGKPNKAVWDYVHKMAAQYDKGIVSASHFKQGNGISWEIIPPAIDPLTEKNRELDEHEIKAILKKHNIPSDKPFITQVSRFDPWKDPKGVIAAFREARKTVDCNLVFVYNGASDDPQGDIIRQQVLDAIDKGAYKDDIYTVRGDDPKVVNAFQRASAVVLQKSIKEGFALTVSEALWKGTPVIATDVGGIPLQVKHGENGYLARSYRIDQYGQPENDSERQAHIKEVAQYICELVSHPRKAKTMGKAGKEHVRKNFLITRLMRDYLRLLRSLQ